MLSATNMFCHMWIQEYLPTLIHQKKWATKCQHLEIGDLAIIPVEHTARSHLPLGRIVDIYPGKDNIVCSVKVQKPNGKFVRPSRRLCLLKASRKCLEHGFVYLLEEEGILGCKNEQI